MMRRIYGLLFSFVTILSVFFITSCRQPGYNYWDINRFNMVDSALHEDEPVRLLYFSRAPDDNKDLDYFLHLVVVSQNTGDTVNILTVLNFKLEQEDGDKTFQYYPFNAQMSKDLVGAMFKTDKDLTGQINNIHKVIRDPQFDHIADNYYPTVKGIITQKLR